MNIVYVFDVDGVLTDRSQPIDTEFQRWFLNWCTDKTFYLLTGSDRQKTIDQIGIEIVKKAEIGFHCLGNSIWFDENREVLINQFELKFEEVEWLNNEIKNSSFVHKTGNHLEKRKGSYNFSIIGKNATIEQRQEYIKYDSEHKEREKLINKLTQHFPRLKAYIGGDVSIDICLLGANKGQCINFIGNFDKLYFFGDRCFPFGIDYPFSKLADDNNFKAEQIDYGYKQTWEILKSL